MTLSAMLIENWSDIFAERDFVLAQSARAGATRDNDQAGSGQSHQQRKENEPLQGHLAVSSIMKYKSQAGETRDLFYVGRFKLRFASSIN
jgi:hypothetical protein